jgi:hypothetical protein
LWENYQMEDIDIEIQELELIAAQLAMRVKADQKCPKATSDIATNLENRGKAIKTAMYGPLNPSEPNDEYWQKIGKEWDVTPQEAKKQLCGNCTMFIVTPQMKSCIEGGLNPENKDEWESIDSAGQLGYCEAFDFKCASKRTCRAWVTGGPITQTKSEEGIIYKELPLFDEYYSSIPTVKSGYRDIDVKAAKARKLKNPKGGLTAAGRAYFKRTQGANLKPGVKGPADTPEKMRRKGSFLTRFFTNPSGPMKDEKGRPTRLALSAAAWGEPVPQDMAAAAKLAAKGRRLLERYENTKKKK